MFLVLNIDLNIVQGEAKLLILVDLLLQGLPVKLADVVLKVGDEGSTLPEVILELGGELRSGEVNLDCYLVGFVFGVGEFSLADENGGSLHFFGMEEWHPCLVHYLVGVGGEHGLDT